MDFSVEPDFQAKLDWMDTFIREEVEPLDLAFPGRAYQKPDDRLRKIVDPLKAQVRERGLWACHLDEHLGGQGYGQLKLALMNELIGRSAWAPVIFGWLDTPSATEVHQASIARRVLREYSPAPGPWPTEFLPDKTEAAYTKYADIED